MTHNLYELGSTFKPITVAAAIDAGTATDMARRYDATAPIAIAGFLIRDIHPQKRWLNVPETLMHSSNIVTARIADDLGVETVLSSRHGRGGLGEFGQGEAQGQADSVDVDASASPGFQEFVVDGIGVFVVDDVRSAHGVCPFR